MINDTFKIAQFTNTRGIPIVIDGLLSILSTGKE